ncbi:hypothetical protein CONCODRAFT_74238 [Conidiobolus coronatus NRRL 28638]|uniref:RNI-like protein n=1 Tax=Conidiobolus coronatus (strain ATCC 28846 / CBS 209.66 / NRRL 28638) TaxID=796925 RepID=A0A137NRW9_CONC2|nr:hypothetical protein CONCODRAFT_74238 [Conidiobolus coronatus NRRL 28638]|eukprot:KXN65513.1 hypothetical protein CONCODRAFT_74238 [Conidiobolus coronatus NRRL 28638]
MEIEKVEKNVNWLNVIFDKKFLRYIDIQTIKDISLASKLYRKKLQSRLFKNIGFAQNNIKFLPNPVSVYSDYLLNFMLDINTVDDTSNIKLYEIVDQWIINISSSLSAYKAIANGFSLIGVNSLGYYMLPILSNFENLKFLRLENCVIPFMGFSDLGKSLLNLDTLELVHVTFINISSDNFSYYQFKFPEI